MGARTVLCLALLTVALAASAHAGGSAESALEKLLRNRSLRGAQVGLAVSDLVTGESLLERHAERPLVPASNQKLLVAAAALMHWGPTHRFETRILSEAPVGADGSIDGPLWVVGSGDPSLVSESLWKLAEELRLRGVREIWGGIAVDASYFDSAYTHRDWEPISSHAYHARVSAFAANYSSFRVDVAGARRSGQPALVSVAPDVSYFRVSALAPTVPGNGHLQLQLEKLPDDSGETVRVKGAMPYGRKPKTYWRSVQLPERYAVSVLRSQLAAQGVHVSGPTRFSHAPSDAVELLSFRGEPVGQIVQKLNKYSNNFIAEQLVKLLGAEWSGAPGGWETGTDAIRELLEGPGVIGEGTVIADGSGLSPRNRVSPATLVRVILYSGRHFDSGPEFLASLPLSGLDGTLEDRMEERPVSLRGKTGHLRSVAALSGVLAGADGRWLAFSLLVNGGRGGREDVDEAIDEFIARLAEVSWPEGEEAQGATGD